MQQSSTRNNFLDILIEPTTIAILGSIAVHAALAANLALFTRPQPEGKKAEPGTVKVVELTPSELQRIPQLPPPVSLPQQFIPPVYQPSTPVPPALQPNVSKIAPSPQVIPTSPVRTPPQVKPPKGKKAQKATPQEQPSAPNFDPNFSFKPSPASKIKSPSNRKGSIDPDPKISAQPSITPKLQPSPKSVKSPKSTITPNFGDYGMDTPGPITRPIVPSKVGQNPPSGTPQPSGTPAATPTATPTTQPSEGNGDGGSGFYGKYTQAANAKLQEYIKKYPNLKTYPPKPLSQPYPPDIVCSKVKQPPFIVLMVAFDKVPEGQDTNILGNGTSPLLNDDKPYIDGDPATLANKKMLEIATTAGFADATEADKKRPAADKGVPVLYQYRVQFDPASCKN